MSFSFPINAQDTANNKKMMGDLLKVFTVTVVKEFILSNLYKNKGPYFGKKWATTTAITLFGFLVYYLIVSKFILFKFRKNTDSEVYLS
jgi:hypothetical protein